MATSSVQDSQPSRLLDAQLGDCLVIAGGQSATRVCGVALRSAQQDEDSDPLLIADAYEYKTPGGVINQYLVTSNTDKYTTHDNSLSCTYKFRFNSGANVQTSGETINDDSTKESQLVELLRGVAHLTYSVWHDECGRFIHGGGYACDLDKSYHTEARTVETSLFHDCDIGLASAVLYGRLFENYQPSPITLATVRQTARNYTLHRQKHITRHDSIQRPYNIYPRRLWDLHANRVVPFYIIPQALSSSTAPFFLAISHSWRPHAELVYHETPINSFAWPVPLPVGLDLETVRAHIMQLDLSQNYRYVWLDVLCLRQASAGDGLDIPPHQMVGLDSLPYERRKKIDRMHQEGNDQGWLASLSLARDHDGSLRQKELAIDVPTIGNIYVKAGRVLRYFNGLGRPLELTGWDHETHWLNRAWTLQEHVRDTIDFGVENITGCHLNRWVTKRGVTRRVREHLQDVYQAVVADRGLIALSAEMGRRSATWEVDKISGLGYALQLPELPVYTRKIDPPSAWRSCLMLLSPKLVAELFFNCPVAGDQPHSWAPKWSTLLSLPQSFVPFPPIKESELLATGPDSRGTLSCRVLCIFPTSITRVAGTDVDYAITLGPQYNNVKLFIGHDGLELPKINEIQTRWLLVRAECMGPDSNSASDWIGSWVLLAEEKDNLHSDANMPRTEENSKMFSRYCKKLASFRCDTNFAMWVHSPAWIEVHVHRSLIKLTMEENYKHKLDWMVKNPLILDA